MADNRHHPAAVQAGLAGKVQDLFGFTGDGKHGRQCITGHIIGYRKIGVVSMIAEFPDVEEEVYAISRQRVGGAGTDENSTFRSRNNIYDLLEQFIEFVIIDALRKAYNFAGTDIRSLGLILPKI